MIFYTGHLIDLLRIRVTNVNTYRTIFFPIDNFCFLLKIKVKFRERNYQFRWMNVPPEMIQTIYVNTGRTNNNNRTLYGILM